MKSAGLGSRQTTQRGNQSREPVTRRSGVHSTGLWSVQSRQNEGSSPVEGKLCLQRWKGGTVVDPRTKVGYIIFDGFGQLKSI
jgi:hypothetical protein